MLDRLRSFFPKNNPSNEELIFLSDDPNGFEREKAIQGMRAKTDAVFLSALLVRVNDWVPRVRALARSAIIELMSDANRSIFIERFDEIWTLKTKKRCDHSPLIEEITQFILTDNGQDQLIQKIRCGKPALARIAYELLTQRLPAAELVDLALTSHDSVITKRGSPFINQLNNDTFDRIFSSIMKTEGAYIRCVALQIGMKRIPAKVESTCINTLLDKSTDIRSISIEFFRNHGLDIKEFYLNNLRDASSQKIRAIAILGLGQAKCVDCAESIRPYLSSPFVVIREAAFRTLYFFIPQDKSVRNAVLDDSPRVSHTALFMIRKNEKVVTMDELNRWFELSPPHARSGLLRLSHNAGKWTELIFILRFYSQSPELHLLRLKTWLNVFNDDQTHPSSEQVSILLGFKQIISEVSDSDVLNLLRFTLKPYNIVV